MKKAEKPLFVENLKEELKAATAMVLVDFQGLSVKLQQELKKRLKTQGARLTVVKNTLFKIASEKADMPENLRSDSVLSGPTALVITEGDPIAPLQILAKFASEFEIPKFKVGVVEGKFQDKESLISLSKLPSKNILLGQTVGSISSPLYGVVFTLQSNLQKLVFILKTKSESN